jgi:hypothetical protein
MSAIYRSWGKRLFDLAVYVPAMIIAAPVLGLLALGTRMILAAPIIFRQLRPGLQGQPFAILKFRTMIDARDIQGNLLPDAERLTALGRFLRSTSLDELPKLAAQVVQRGAGRHAPDRSAAAADAVPVFAGAWATIGAGAVVNKPVPVGIIVGVPARPLQKG